jgi:hypothetical protein
MKTTVVAEVLGVPVSMYAMDELRVLIVFFSKGKSGQISFVVIFDMRTVNEAQIKWRESREAIGVSSMT